MSTKAGNVPVKFTGNSLYLTMGGGTFEQGDVKGHFASVSTGTALIIYIDGGGSYQCDIEDVIKVAVAHHKKRKKKP